jgi:hypothetical protein
MADESKNYWNDEPSEAPEERLVAPDEALDDEQFQPQELAEEDTPDNPPITWSAVEYIHIDKGLGWYVLFVLVVLGFIALDVLVLHSWTLSVLVVVMAIAVVIYIRRPARTLTYALSPKQGLYIGEQLYEFERFKAFGLIKDGDNHSIMLIPRKRFGTGVSVYFPEDAGERIVDILGQRLPMETLKLDVVDVIVRKLRL